MGADAVETADTDTEDERPVQQKVVTAQVPVNLLGIFDSMWRRRYPGVARQVLIRAAMSLALEVEPDTLSRHVGKY